MYAIRYVSSDLQKKLANLEQYYPPEVCQELPQFVEALQKDGGIKQTDFYRGNINRLSAATFYLFYVSDPFKRTVTIIEMRIRSTDLLRQRFTINDNWDDKDVIDSIPQYDRPDKIIKAIELTHQGVVDTYQLGNKLGHKGKQDRYIRRHGQYAQHTLKQLKLIVRTRRGRSLVPELTHRGKLIAEAPNQDLKNRLLIEAMLNYQPVWRIIGAVTEDDKELNDGLVKQLAFPTEFQEANTSDRRSQTLRKWIKYISVFSGIPIRLHSDGVQLPIPMLYGDANTEQEDENTEQE